MPIDDRPTIAAPDDDPYLWLEEIEGERALDFVDRQSLITLETFGGRPFEKDLEGPIEGRLRRVEMTGFELLPSVFEVLVRERDQIGDGIGLGSWSRARGRCLRNRGRRLRGMGPLLIASAPDREQRDEAHPPRQAATCRRHGVNVL